MDYVLKTGAGDYEKTPGNLGFQILLRDLGDATSEVTTLSWWRSMDAIRAFAGPDPGLARYYRRTIVFCSPGPSMSSITS